MKEFDRAVKEELYFQLQKTPNKDKEFEALLLSIIGLIQSGKSQREIKKHIKGVDIESDLNELLKRQIEEKFEIITGEKKNFNLALIAIGGFSFNELVRSRKENIRKRAISFMARAIEEKKQGGVLKRLIERESKRFSKSTEQFWKTNEKAGREYALTERENADNRTVRGWESIGVLDSRTSAICVGLHNKFYSAQDYESRESVPDKPPRHPNCRSILLTVWHGEDIRNFKGENLKTFFKRNEDVARDIMGKDKFELWKSGKAKVETFVDIKGRRFFTNKEIVKRLGIKKTKINKGNRIIEDNK